MYSEITLACDFFCRFLITANAYPSEKILNFKYILRNFLMEKYKNFTWDKFKPLQGNACRAISVLNSSIDPLLLKSACESGLIKGNSASDIQAFHSLFLKHGEIIVWCDPGSVAYAYDDGRVISIYEETSHVHAHANPLLLTNSPNVKAKLGKSSSSSSSSNSSSISTSVTTTTTLTSSPLTTYTQYISPLSNYATPPTFTNGNMNRSPSSSYSTTSSTSTKSSGSTAYSKYSSKRKERRKNIKKTQKKQSSQQQQQQQQQQQPLTRKRNEVTSTTKSPRYQPSALSTLSTTTLSINTPTTKATTNATSSTVNKKSPKENDNATVHQGGVYYHSKSSAAGYPLKATQNNNTQRFNSQPPSQAQPWWWSSRKYSMTGRSPSPSHAATTKVHDIYYPGSTTPPFYGNNIYHSTLVA